jgi:hypothetical protein
MRAPPRVQGQEGFQLRAGSRASPSPDPVHPPHKLDNLHRLRHQTREYCWCCNLCLQQYSRRVFSSPFTSGGLVVPPCSDHPTDAHVGLSPAVPAAQAEVSWLKVSCTGGAGGGALDLCQARDPLGHGRRLCRCVPPAADANGT